LGGNIVVVSEYGKGSIFKVLLPFQKLPANIASNNEIKTDFIPAYYYTGASVLVVEDNKVNQLLLQHTLAELDITAQVVANGQEALDALAKKKFDLILLDIQMPVMDGYTTIAALRKTVNIITPVVAMTAYAMPGEKEKCLAAGMNGYLAKPIDFPQLISVLEQFLPAAGTAEQKPGVSPKEGDNFLLLLAGGDKNIVRRILEEIKQEIPHAIARLETVRNNKDVTELNNICHHMISTFAPMGNETTVMKKIQQLRNLRNEEENSYNNTGLIAGLQKELTRLEQELKEKMERME
jgi:CheY-like chemotaxis protein